MSFGHSLEVVLRSCQPESIYLCDSWGGESGGEQFGGHGHITALLERLKYRGAVSYLDGDSHELLPRLIRRQLQFDLILVDGDHSLEGARRDLEDCWRLLADDGALVFDDLRHPSHPGLKEVFEEFCKVNAAWVVAVDIEPMGAATVRKCATS